MQLYYDNIRPIHVNVQHYYVETQHNCVVDIIISPAKVIILYVEGRSKPPKHVMIPTAISEPYLYTESKSIFIYFKNSLKEAFYTAVGS